ncbi:hypothetical protein [Hamadaea tsunoensis]|uniref:hypothetical protein n=1 Tax=Hamadaea tsunoensis TaxID=53368 RepID=UPI000404FB2B|nr:hypothetical protein [Hamadaea tsunoensis]
MSTDPSTNMVAFEVQGHPEPFIASGPTQDEYSIQRAWYAVPLDHATAAAAVTRIYSEWQPSAADEEFIGRTFPQVAVTYSFERPERPDGWPDAFAAVQRQLAAAQESRAAAEAVENMNRTAEHGELLPVLWSSTSPSIGMLEHLPHAEVVPGRLRVAVAAVAPTPQGKIGMSHVTYAKLGDDPFADLFDTAARTLVQGLKVDGHADERHPEKGQLLVLRREGMFASSAVALPDFHRQMSAALGADDLVVGLPDPDTVLVTRADSGWVGELHQAVLESPCPVSELVPVVLAFDGTAPPRLLAERP